MGRYIIDGIKQEVRTENGDICFSMLELTRDRKTPIITDKPLLLQTYVERPAVKDWLNLQEKNLGITYTFERKFVNNNEMVSVVVEKDGKRKEVWLEDGKDTITIGSDVTRADRPVLEKMFKEVAIGHLKGNLKAENLTIREVLGLKLEEAIQYLKYYGGGKYPDFKETTADNAIYFLMDCYGGHVFLHVVSGNNILRALEYLKAELLKDDVNIDVNICDLWSANYIVTGVTDELPIINHDGESVSSFNVNQKIKILLPKYYPVKPKIEDGISYIPVYYNGGNIGWVKEKFVKKLESGSEGQTEMPLNDYKTLANSNLIGIGASKKYITLAQMNSFNFEYNRQTYINKLTSYTADSFRGVVSNITAYLNEIQNQLDYLNNEFKNISNQDIVSNFNYYIEKYGIGRYDESVLMFMAITAQESQYGKKMAEIWDSTLGYVYNQRGGGYSQLTGITTTNLTGNQVPFMTSIGYSNNDISSILDLPFHIATYLPMSSACYSWVKGNAISCDITKDVVEYGINKGAEMKLVYLAISYAINGGYTKSGLQTILDRKTFSEPINPPNGWEVRKNAFNAAIDIFPNGASTFIPF